MNEAQKSSTEQKKIKATKTISWGLLRGKDSMLSLQGGMGSIAGQGTKMAHAAWHNQTTTTTKRLYAA